MMSRIWLAVTPWYFSHEPWVSRLRVLAGRVRDAANGVDVLYA
jgi:hypothetical protein